MKKAEQEKWEIALELGLFDKVVETGWKSLTARESGRIGGILSSRQSKTQPQKKDC
ncbi:MAG: alpha/beta-type small acid-soluble spore protein [Clostridiaceae bacterium]|nr:alpha/beta-type small acid-soluble spore protein [Clostridiaceae bacterium]